MKIDTRKWIAGQLNEKWSDKKSPLVEISIQNQHLDAVRELKDLIQQEPEKIESTSLNGISSEDYEEEKL